MLDNTTLRAADDLDPVPFILAHLSNGNEVIRCGAVRAAAAVAGQDGRVHDALLARLLDEDPDVRTDAMDALMQCARPEDADTLRLSLCGDPVREIKHAAILALTGLRCQESVPIFRKLVASRASVDVAWEDDSDSWDDWLDVQIAVIKALGELNAKECIQDLLDARDDEEGQVLDGPVFTALAAMGNEGATWLLSIAQTETGLGRKRALETLAEMRSDLLRDAFDVIVEDPAADIRRLALPLLETDDARIEAMALRDPDEDLRCEALTLFASVHPDLAVKALADPSEAAQAIALDHLPLPLEGDLHTTLTANVIAWTSISKSKLATAAARILPRLALEHAIEPLLALIHDTARPLEARLAAVTALDTLNDPLATERLIALLSHETQQVRAVALTHLVTRCENGDRSAGRALAMSIDRTLLSQANEVVVREDEDGPDLAMSKTDTPPRGHIKISRDGEIINVDQGEKIDATQSTLGALQHDESQFEQADLAEDTPEESSAKRRHRRPVEGPDTIADDLRVVALGIAGGASDPAIEAAMLTATVGEEDTLRLAAWRALEKRANGGILAALGAFEIQIGLSDEHPAIRSAAANILAMNPETAPALRACLSDPDALVRAIAVRNCATTDEATAALKDSASVVRAVALDRILPSNDSTLIKSVFEALSKAERINTLAGACSRSDTILSLCFQALSESDVTPRQTHILLEALAQSSPSVAKS